MPDYGHDLRFGIFVTPTAAAHEQVVRTAVTADVLGLDSVSVQDHPYQPAFLDTWTLLTHLAARTERVRAGQVLGLSLQLVERPGEQNLDLCSPVERDLGDHQLGNPGTTQQQVSRAETPLLERGTDPPVDL